jgi:glutamyl/glutaminyl-tRNA synthetase
VYVWGVAGALGGEVVLRMEDHDRERCRPQHERAILEELEWLGLGADGAIGALRAGPSPYRQSDATAHYEAALQRLRRSAEIYACDCSRKAIAAAADAARTAERPYPGTCRHRGLAEAPRRGLRVVMDAGLESFDDALLGAQEQEPRAQCGDVLVRDRLGFWTYQLAVVVDDIRHGIDLVIRGRDLLESTGRQMRLSRLLGRPAPPVFLHHALVLGSSGEKLSKSNRDAGVNELREAGLSPPEVLGMAAHAIGLLDAPAAVEARDLPLLFDRS